MRYVLLITSILFCLGLQAQKKGSSETLTEEQNVTNTINGFFDAIRTGDSSMLRFYLHPDVDFKTIHNNSKGGKSISEENVESFIEEVGKPRVELWDERLESMDIKINNELASVWAPYVFYLDKRPLHKGVNSIQLFKSFDGWKIVQIIDTREPIKEE